MGMGGVTVKDEPRGKSGGYDGKISIARERLDRGGYDSRGRYFGVGAPLFRASNASGSIDFMLRAKDRAAAIAKVREDYPVAKIAGSKTPKAAPPGPASGFGKEKSAADIRARIKWESWAETKARSEGHNAHADGHALTRAGYEDNLALLKGGAKARATAERLARGAIGAIRGVREMKGLSKPYGDQRGVAPGRYLDVHGREVAGQIYSSAGAAWQFHQVGSGTDPVTCPERHWRQVEHLASVPVHVLGRRKIDGADVIVFRQARADDQQSGVFAQTALSVRKG